MSDKNPTDPVPRWEYEALEKRVGQIEEREKTYVTKEFLGQQFKIELSDYKTIKVILGIIGVSTVSLIFALLQQFFTNLGAR